MPATYLIGLNHLSGNPFPMLEQQNGIFQNSANSNPYLVDSMSGDRCSIGTGLLQCLLLPNFFNCPITPTHASFSISLWLFSCPRPIATHQAATAHAGGCQPHNTVIRASVITSTTGNTVSCLTKLLLNRTWREGHKMTLKTANLISQNVNLWFNFWTK